MGKGDKKTRRGKINRGSYGVLRPRQKSTPTITAVKKPKAEPKAEPKEETKVVKAAKKPTTKAKTTAAPKKKSTAKKTVASTK